MTWGAVATVGASVVSGALSKSSSDSASAGVGQANALTQEQIRNQQNQNNTAFSPYVRAGSNANRLLDYYLGTADTSAQGQYNSKYGSLVDTSSGIPKPIASLYSSDPAYKKAWDDYQTMNYAQYKNTRKGGGAYTKDSDANQIENYIRSNLPGSNTFSAMDTSDGKYGSLMRNFGQSDLNNDVVYNNGLQFGLDEGEKAVNRLAAARGGIDSGATLKGIARYANDYATTKTQGAYDRFNNDKGITYGMLSGQQGVGLNATTSNQGMNNSLLTTGINSNNNAANLQGQYGMQGAAGLNNSIQGGIGNYLYNQRLNNGSVVGSSGGGTYGSGYGYSSNSPWLS